MKNLTRDYSSWLLILVYVLEMNISRKPELYLTFNSLNEIFLLSLFLRLINYQDSNPRKYGDREFSCWDSFVNGSTIESATSRGSTVGAQQSRIEVYGLNCNLITWTTVNNENIVYNFVRIKFAYKRLKCRELKSRELKCRGAQLSRGSLVGSSDVGSSTVGRLKCRGSAVGAQLSRAQLSCHPLCYIYPL